MNKTKNEKNGAATAIVEPKRYEETFKRQAVEHWLRSGKNGTQIAQELGISYPSLKEWKRRYGGTAAPQRADLEAENRALRAELARVREQRDIQKKRWASSRKCPARYERIEAMKNEHSLAALCAALGVSRPGYYRWKDAEPGLRAREDAELTEAIRVVHGEHRGVYGSPRVLRALRARGRQHSRKRIARLMRAEGLRGKCPRRFVPRTTQSGHAEPIAPNRLAEQPKPTAPNQVWVSDITYVRTAEGWLYVAAILDLYSRRIVGWATSASLAAELVLAALSMALLHRHPPAGLLYHSDRGVQYACGDFRAALADARFVASMSRKGNGYDNATMESFWNSFKRECAEELYPTRRNGTAAAFDYIETFYNRVRLHSALGYQSPVDFENQLN